MRDDNIAGVAYEILVDGKNKYQTNIKSDLFSTLEWMVTYNALSHIQVFFQLHAGAVIKNGQIILLPANHG